MYVDVAKQTVCFFNRKIDYDYVINIYEGLLISQKCQLCCKVIARINLKKTKTTHQSMQQ